VVLSVSWLTRDRVCVGVLAVPLISAVEGFLGASGISIEELLMRKLYGFRAALRKRVRLVVRLRLGYRLLAGESRDKAVVVHCCLYIHYYLAVLVGRALSLSAFPSSPS